MGEKKGLQNTIERFTDKGQVGYILYDCLPDNCTIEQQLWCTIALF